MRISDLRTQLLEWIRTIIGVSSRRISGGESLTDDLGMDSLHLMQLFSTVDSEIGAIDMMPWLVSSSTSGLDTVDALYNYIATALQAAEHTRAER
jgi:acyl carrier protein